MDPKRQAILKTFLMLNHHQVAPSSDGERRAYLHFLKQDDEQNGDALQNTELVCLCREDVEGELDIKNALVKELLRQMTTYDPYEQRVIGIVFAKDYVLSEVLQNRPVAEDEE